MAKRRELKKNANCIAGESFLGCLISSMFVLGTDKVKADKLMTEILKMQSELISRISHTESGNVEGFHRKLHVDLNARVDEIIDATAKLN